MDEEEEGGVNEKWRVEKMNVDVKRLRMYYTVTVYVVKNLFFPECLISLIVVYIVLT